ncbi:MAG: hypothetical protein KQA38_03430 [Candidatus Aenigmarchaeota archaeon]|nr:hypothetical protein [Candidatus Aenigmarchaeota archaeon]
MVHIDTLIYEIKENIPEFNRDDITIDVNGYRLWYDEKPLLELLLKERSQLVSIPKEISLPLSLYAVSFRIQDNSTNENYLIIVNLITKEISITRDSENFEHVTQENSIYRIVNNIARKLGYKNFNSY